MKAGELDWILSMIPVVSNGTCPAAQPATATQVGGTHYKDMAIQPCDFILKNGLGWAEGTAIAYIARWKQKGGVQDLRKAIHTLELLIESEG